MLKNILKLKGAQQLSKNEQKTLNGACKTNSGLICRIGFEWDAFIRECVRVPFFELPIQ